MKKSDKDGDVERAAESLARRMVAKNRKADDDVGTKYKITPKGALWLRLIEMYGDADWDRLEEFQKKLVQDLSLILSDGASDRMLGDDVNQLMAFVQNMMCMAEDMYDELGRNGIEFDIGKYGVSLYDADDPDGGLNEEDEK